MVTFFVILWNVLEIFNPYKKNAVIYTHCRNAVVFDFALRGIPQFHLMINGFCF